MRRALLAAALAAALMGPGVSRADGVDQTCELTATRFDADTMNVLFPDSPAWSPSSRAESTIRMLVRS